MHSKTEAAAVNRRARLTVLVLGIMSVALLALAAAVVYAEVRTSAPWDPLGEYPTQTVTSRVPGVEGPAVRVGGAVDVEAVKCGSTDGPTDVTTTLVWKSVDPAGSTWTRGESQAVRDAGCTALEFHNVLPPEVRALIVAQHEAGFTEPVWRITGTETPVDSDGRSGVPRRWVTENFAVVP